MPRTIQKQVGLQLVALNNPSPISLSINILTSVIFSASIEANDLMRDFSQDHNNESSFFKGMTDQLNNFLSATKEGVLVKLEVVFSLTDAIGTVNYELMT